MCPVSQVESTPPSYCRPEIAALGRWARVASVRSLLVVLAVLPFTALAQVNECAEVFSECKEDCSIEHSSLRGDAPKKLNKCIKKCQKKFTTCEERELETKNNALEAGSLDKSPASSDVDESGMPTRTAVKKSKSTDDEERRPSPGDDLRDDRPAPAPAPEPKKSAKAPKAEPVEERRAPREEVRESEIPKSSRSELKVDPKEEKKEARAEPPPPASKKGEPEPIVMTPKADSKRPVDEDLRDDRPRASEPAPPPKKTERKKDDLPPPPPKAKEEDHDDLRNY